MPHSQESLSHYWLRSTSIGVQWLQMGINGYLLAELHLAGCDIQVHPY
jgi:hypothetical protein